MDRSHPLILIGQTYTQDEIGQHIAIPAARQVFCAVSSITANERESAGREGIEAAYRVKIFRYDYQKEERAKLDNVEYSIYRTYIDKGELIDLYLGKKAGV